MDSLRGDTGVSLVGPDGCLTPLTIGTAPARFARKRPATCASVLRRGWIRRASGAKVLSVNLAKNASQYLWLASIRLTEATVLLRARRWAGALYISGYVCECAMKAMLLRIGTPEVIRDLLKTHDLAGIKEAIRPALATSDRARLEDVDLWSHLLRYCTTAPNPTEAVAAINRAKGVYQCLSTYI